MRTGSSRCTGPDVLAGRPDDLVVRVLLEDVRRLARDPAALEQRREQVVRDPEVAVEGAAVEVDVRPEALLLVGGALGRLRDRVPVRLAALLGELLAEPLEDAGPRIGRHVDRVPEAEERPLLREQRRTPSSAASGEPNSSKVRIAASLAPPCGRALERADRRGDRRVEVGSGAGDDARGERGRVQLVLGVQDHRHVEGARLAFGRALAPQHREEVLGVRELGIRLDGRELLAQAVVAGDDRRQLRDQRRRLPPVVLAVDRRLGGICEREQRGGRAEHLHRRDVVRVAVDERARVARQLTLRELFLEGAQLLLARQLALEQEVRDLLVGRMLGEIGDVVAAVAEDAVLGVDRADGRLGDRDSGERD